MFHNRSYSQHWPKIQRWTLKRIHIRCRRLAEVGVTDKQWSYDIDWYVLLVAQRLPNRSQHYCGMSIAHNCLVASPFALKNKVFRGSSGIYLNRRCAACLRQSNRPFNSFFAAWGSLPDRRVIWQSFASYIIMGLSWFEHRFPWVGKMFPLEHTISYCTTSVA